jgi:hypothetical protein
MDGYSLTEKMRKARRRERLTALEQALYYELVAVCNDNGWGDVFDCSNIELCLALNINEKTLTKARETLINAGLIYYKSGKSKHLVSLYSFLKPLETTVKITVDKTANTPTNQTTNVTANKTANTPDLFKGKTKTKRKTINPPTPLPEEDDAAAWRNDFEKYKSDLRSAYTDILNDLDFIAEQERYHPGLDIFLSIEKCCVQYWSMEAGWKKKKASKSNKIDWKATFRNALNIKSNQVWQQKN